jgi:hypothetical protein
MIVIENINLIKEYNCPYTMCGQLVYNVVNYQNDWSGEVSRRRKVYTLLVKTWITKTVYIQRGFLTWLSNN